MIDESNPGGRLHRILSEVAAKNGEGICVRDAWAPVFGCAAKDEAAVLRGLVEVYNEVMVKNKGSKIGMVS